MLPLRYFIYAPLLVVVSALDPAPTVPIGNRIVIPMVTLGMGSGQKGDVSNATEMWLSDTDGAGVSIDTAWDYQDEEEIGEGIAVSGRPRGSVFLETKIQAGTYDEARKQIRENLVELGMTYVDLTLIHWPSTSAEMNSETWRALEDALAANQTRAIGLSSFGVDDLKALQATATVWPPALNQCELSISYHDDAAMAYHAAQGITYQSFSPLCGGFNGSSCSAHGGQNVLDIPEVQEVAVKMSVSPAQVGLKWIVQQGYPLVTATWKLESMQEDLDLWSWGDISDDDMAMLSAIYQFTKKDPPA